MLKQWGTGLLAVESIAALIQLLRVKVSYHYSVFAGPTAYFWRGENPYAVFFVPGNDEQRYLYSPTFSMFYFLPFARMSETWGRFAYVSISLLVLFCGIYYWARPARSRCGIEFAAHPWRNLALAMMGAELFGGIYFCKVEMIEVGILFILMRMLTAGRIALPFFILGLLAEVKFQTVPVIGLCFLALLLLDAKPVRAAMTSVAASVSGFVLGAVLPLVVASPAKLLEWNQARFANIEHVITHYWREHYQPIYKVLLAAQAGVTLQQVQLLNVAGGLFFAGLVVLLIRGYGDRTEESRRDLGFLTAISFGLLFNLLCSPMAQTNAYVFIVPTLALLMVLSPHGENKSTVVLMVVAFFLISILYSDLVPRSWNLWARQWGVKPWGLVLLLVAVVKDGFRVTVAPPVKHETGLWLLSQRVR